MTLLLDTHVLVWIGAGDERLPTAVLDRLFDPAQELALSAVTAYEYADLHHRGRIPAAAELVALQDQLGLRMIDFPADLWAIAATLPALHGDPIDRMLIAHALSLDLELVSADRMIRQYPIRVVWD